MESGRNPTEKDQPTKKKASRRHSHVCVFLNQLGRQYSLSQLPPHDSLRNGNPSPDGQHSAVNVLPHKLPGLGRPGGSSAFACRHARRHGIFFFQSLIESTQHMKRYSLSSTFLAAFCHSLATERESGVVSQWRLRAFHGYRSWCSLETKKVMTR